MLSKTTTFAKKVGCQEGANEVVELVEDSASPKNLPVPVAFFSRTGGTGAGFPPRHKTRHLGPLSKELFGSWLLIVIHTVTVNFNLYFHTTIQILMPL